MKAKYAGTCSLCSDAIAEGDDIGKYLGGAVHTACRAEVIEAGKTITVSRFESSADLARVRRYTRMKEYRDLQPPK